MGVHRGVAPVHRSQRSGTPLWLRGATSSRLNLWVLVGGVYQTRFTESQPVVAQPQRFDDAGKSSMKSHTGASFPILYLYHLQDYHTSQSGNNHPRFLSPPAHLPASCDIAASYPAENR